MYSAISAALNTSLNTLANTKSYVVAWENIAFNERENLYLKPYHMPAITVSTGFGDSAPNRYRGIYQIDVCYTVNQGWKPAADIADIIIKHFARGTKLISGSLVIESSYAMPARVVEGKYIISVAVTYRAIGSE